MDFLFLWLFIYIILRFGDTNLPKLENVVKSRNLAQYSTLVTDTFPNSQYFKLTQIPDVLTAGKNAFLIAGSVFLEPTTKVLVEIIDGQGNTIYEHAVPNYQEGLARVVSIEIYDDTPSGLATMTILGEAQQLADGSPIPSEWQNKYNVKYTHTFVVNPGATNTSPIRLYTTPKLYVSESLFGYRDTSYSYNQTFGNFTGSSQVYGVSTASYAIQLQGGGLSKQMEGGVFEIQDYHPFLAAQTTISSSNFGATTFLGPETLDQGLSTGTSSFFYSSGDAYITGSSSGSYFFGTSSGTGIIYGGVTNAFVTFNAFSSGSGSQVKIAVKEQQSSTFLANTIVHLVSSSWNHYELPITSSLSLLSGSFSYTIQLLDNQTFVSMSMFGIREDSHLYAPYTASIVEVLNDSTFLVNPAYTVSGTVQPFIASEAVTPILPVILWTSSANFTTPTEYTRSFANVLVNNLTTFSGDVKRGKLFVRSVDSNGNYELVSDSIITGADILLTSSANTLTQISMGHFTDASIISYWNTGSILSSSFNFMYVPSNSQSLQLNSTALIQSVNLVNSSSLSGTGSSTPQYYFGITQPLVFFANAEYTLQNTLVCKKLVPNFNALIEVYLSGSAFPSTNPLGHKIASYQCNYPQNRATIINDQTNFVSPNNGTANLYYVVYSGDWSVGNIDIISAEENGFNPDVAQFYIPITNKRLENLQFKLELYDINNNLVPVDIESTPKFFVGSNLYTKGIDNRIQGTLTVSPSGSGPTIGVDPSGSYIGIGQDVLPRPIDISLLPNYFGSPIITLYSGSTPFSGSTSGSAVGFQIAGGFAGGTSGSFLDYNTVTGRLTIRGDISLLPGTALSQSIANAGSSSGAQALTQLQQLVSGTLLGGTYLNGTEIISPNIAGTTGYFSTIFGVGNVINGQGIVLSALGYTASNGTPQSGSPAIYIGQGSYANANTPFFVGSSSAGGILSLGNQLVATSSGGNFSLIVSGTLAVLSGSVFTDVRTFINSVSSSASASQAAYTTQVSASVITLASSSIPSISASQAAYTTTVSASMYAVSASLAQTTASLASYSASVAQSQVTLSSSLSQQTALASASLAAQNISFSQSQALANVVDAAHRIQLPTNISKTVNGLYLEAADIGFWQNHPSGNGISASNFPVLINSGGQFIFADSASWTGSSTTGYWSNYIESANGSFIIQTPNLYLNTPGLQIAGFASSASNLSFIKLGANAFSMSLAHGAGFYTDGAGNFRVGSDTSGSDFILLQPGNALIVSSSNFILQSNNAGNVLHLDPFQISLGNPNPLTYVPTGSGAQGFYVNRNGQLFLGSGSVDPTLAGIGTGSWLSFDGSSLNTRLQRIFLNANGLFLQGADNLTGSGNVIKLGTAGQNVTLTKNQGFYVDGGGAFRIGTDTSSSISSSFLQFVPGPTSSLIISSSTFFLNAADGNNNTIKLNNFVFALGNPIPTTYTPIGAGSVGLYADNQGHFFIGSGSVGSIAGQGTGSWLSFDASTLNARLSRFFLNSNGLVLQGADSLSATANVIKVGGAGSGITLNNNAGFYVDGGGNFRVGTDSTGSDFIQLSPGNPLIISSSRFFLNTPTISIISTAQGSNPVLYISSSNGAAINISADGGTASFAGTVHAGGLIVDGTAVFTGSSILSAPLQTATIKTLQTNKLTNTLFVSQSTAAALKNITMVNGTETLYGWSPDILNITSSAASSSVIIGDFQVASGSNPGTQSSAWSAGGIVILTAQSPYTASNTKAVVQVSPGTHLSYNNTYLLSGQMKMVSTVTSATSFISMNGKLTLDVSYDNQATWQYVDDLIQDNVETPTPATVLDNWMYSFSPSSSLNNNDSFHLRVTAWAAVNAFKLFGGDWEVSDQSDNPVQWNYSTATTYNRRGLQILSQVSGSTTTTGSIASFNIQPMSSAPNATTMVAGDVWAEQTGSLNNTATLYWFNGVQKIKLG